MGLRVYGLKVWGSEGLRLRASSFSRLPHWDFRAGKFEPIEPLKFVKPLEAGIRGPPNNIVMRTA